jgi:hypothetical protein
MPTFPTSAFAEAPLPEGIETLETQGVCYAARVEAVDDLPSGIVAMVVRGTVFAENAAVHGVPEKRTT